MDIFYNPDELDTEDLENNDLFERYDEQPDNVRTVTDYYSQFFGGGGCILSIERFLKDLNELGYTFEYGLDMNPYGLAELAADSIKRPAKKELVLFEQGAWNAVAKLSQTNSDNARQPIKVYWNLGLNRDHLNKVDAKRLLHPSINFDLQDSRIFSESDAELFGAGAWRVVAKLAETSRDEAIKLSKLLKLDFLHMHELEEISLSESFNSRDAVFDTFDSVGDE